MRILFFGTYDSAVHPRIRVLQEGFAGHGDEVLECNAHLRLPTSLRVAMLRRPVLLPLLAVRLAAAWLRLWWRSRHLARAELDAVLVGYMGQFDVHLARWRWPGRVVVLDHLNPAAEVAADRGVRRPHLLGLLVRLDRLAVGSAGLVVVDTREHLELLPAPVRGRATVVSVGAPAAWFHPPTPATSRPLRVVFFGLYTPLQGAPVIGRALGLLADEPGLRATMIGTGQELVPARRAAAANRRIEWLAWVDPGLLPGLVAAHDVCLGIFGGGDKALRVVPHKAFQGAAAGCAIVTSDTPPQRAALGEAALYVPPGDAAALATVLAGLVRQPELVQRLREAAYRLASQAFRGETVVAPLRARLAGVGPDVPVG